MCAGASFRAGSYLRQLWRLEGDSQQVWVYVTIQLLSLHAFEALLGCWFCTDVIHFWRHSNQVVLCLLRCSRALTTTTVRVPIAEFLIHLCTQMILACSAVPMHRKHRQTEELFRVILGACLYSHRSLQDFLLPCLRCSTLSAAIRSGFPLGESQHSNHYVPVLLRPYLGRGSESIQCCCDVLHDGQAYPINLSKKCQYLLLRKRCAHTPARRCTKQQQR